MEGEHHGTLSSDCSLGTGCTALWNLGSPAFIAPPTLATKPTAFPLGARSHLCAPTDVTAAQQLCRLQHNLRQEVARNAIFYRIPKSREIQVKQEKSLS